ncbi:hypothetical protein RJT34_11513 [Clitoria ternatea]|uniref:Uncharacterized protein n=1 Tax=Clitoria ternatea TaxID=43366 RepID=A0AAN9PII3_CLITE
MVLMSYPRKKSGIEDDGKSIQEVKGDEVAVKAQSIETATKSMSNSLRIVGNGDTEEILQQQPFQEVKPAAIENDRSFREEIELRKTSNVNEVSKQNA